MDEREILLGHRIVVGVAIAVVGLEVLTLLGRVASGQGLPSDNLFRVVLALFLGWNLSLGKAWARWTVAVLVGLGGALALVSGHLWGVLIGLSFVGCVVVLFAVPQVRAFFDYAQHAQ